jgi:hypothetical protein
LLAASPAIGTRRPQDVTMHCKTRVERCTANLGIGMQQEKPAFAMELASAVGARKGVRVNGRNAAWQADRMQGTYWGRRIVCASWRHWGGSVRAVLGPGAVAFGSRRGLVLDVHVLARHLAAQNLPNQDRKVCILTFCSHPVRPEPWYCSAARQSTCTGALTCTQPRIDIKCRTPMGP